MGWQHSTCEYNSILLTPKQEADVNIFLTRVTHENVLSVVSGIKEQKLMIIITWVQAGCGGMSL